MEDSSKAYFYNFDFFLGYQQSNSSFFFWNILKRINAYSFIIFIMNSVLNKYLAVIILL
jgi:hypothetical protein